MRGRGLKALCGAVLCLAAMLAPGVGSAQGAASDPLFVFVPVPPPPSPSPPPAWPPPFAYLSGPCGLGIDPSGGTFWVSDYYHDVVDVYDANADYVAPPQVLGSTGYLGQLTNVDPLDGPCGLAFDALGNLYVNDYHRAVIRYTVPSETGTTITGAGVDEEHPTGVDVDPTTGNVFVNDRTHIATFDSSGSLLEEIGSFANGHGLAVSQYPATAGYLYVPDAATNTIKVYDPATSKVDPVATIDGSATPESKFVSLRDAAIAVDRVTGQVYVVDNLQPEFTERPEAIVYVFSSAGAYQGHLKYKITDPLPPGLAVDNSASANQGRVYVTSGNTAFAGIYAYPPGAATSEAAKPSVSSLSLRSVGTGAGTLSSDLGSLQCTSACSAEIRAGADVTLGADPAPGSAFTGWSGACAGTFSTCTVRMDEAASVRGAFAEVAGPPPAEQALPAMSIGAATSPPAPTSGEHRRRKAHKRPGAGHRHRAHRHNRKAHPRGAKTHR